MVGAVEDNSCTNRTFQEIRKAEAVETEDDNRYEMTFHYSSLFLFLFISYTNWLKAAVCSILRRSCTNDKR
jgi:hypothetical protein